ncbi:50S ribosomal protein L32 [Desulfotruncus alcoholivorax]|uniref:50S ribosomal protein L32 n=1 Tax=Desulfotruncus alcoholivorax TaxID=265477 RepID=UPI0004262999|nr:50S ribosomal protein L32 [Desulfotruncus alcoholivorax]
MGVPKRRMSKQRKRQRRANWKIEAPKLVECPQCHALAVPHQVCAGCGYYKGREIVAK